MDIETQNLIDDLRAELKQVKDEWQLARDNLLWPALIGPGQLVFGGNIMRLDSNGVQILAPTAGPVGIGVNGIWFVPALSAAPGNRNVSTSVFPRSTITGFARIDANPDTLLALESAGEYNETLGRVYTSASGTSAAVGLLAQNTSGVPSDGAAIELTAPDGGPATALLYLNGVTYNLAGGGILTDTAWAAAGDLVYGTGNDTAAILPIGSLGQFLKVNVAANAPSWANHYNINNQTTTYNAQCEEFVRCSGTFTVTLPSAPVTNRYVGVKNVGTGVITVARGGGDTIFTMASGQTSFTVLPGESYEMIYYAASTEWQVY